MRRVAEREIERQRRETEKKDRDRKEREERERAYALVCVSGEYRPCFYSFKTGDIQNMYNTSISF